MNLTVKAAIASALALGAGSAFALPLSSYDATVKNAYISGATAQDPAIGAFMRIKTGLTGVAAICQDGTLDAYETDVPNLNSTGTVKARAWFCTANITIGGASGAKIALHKEAGGSANGITPVANLAALAIKGRNFIDLDYLSTHTSLCAAPVVVDAVLDQNAYNLYVCSGLTVGAGISTVTPDAGLSDVEPGLFQGAITGALAVNSAVTSAIDAGGTAALIFGVPVNKKFRNALQTLQGLIPNTVGPDDVSRETEAAMPSLSTSQLRALTAAENSGSTTWDAFLVDSAGAGINASALLGSQTPAPSSATVWVCRRGQTSGTQAAWVSHFFENRCISGSSAYLNPGTAANGAAWVDATHAATRVFAGSASDDVIKCLNYRDTQNQWSIGVLSTELEGIVAANNGPTRSHRFVKVDGYAPTLLNTAVGKYLFASEAALNKGNINSANNFATKPAATQDIINAFGSGVGNYKVTAQINDAFSQATPTVDNPNRHPWGASGYLAKFDSTADDVILAQGPVPTATSIASTPVTRTARTSNNCRPPVQHLKTPL